MNTVPQFAQWLSQLEQWNRREQDHCALTTDQMLESPGDFDDWCRRGALLMQTIAESSALSHEFVDWMARTNINASVIATGLNHPLLRYTTNFTQPGYEGTEDYIEAHLADCWAVNVRRMQLLTHTLFPSASGIHDVRRLGQYNDELWALLTSVFQAGHAGTTYTPEEKEALVCLCGTTPWVQEATLQWAVLRCQDPVEWAWLFTEKDLNRSSCRTIQIFLGILDNAGMLMNDPQRQELRSTQKRHLSIAALGAPVFFSALQGEHLVYTELWGEPPNTHKAFIAYCEDRAALVHTTLQNRVGTVGMEDIVVGPLLAEDAASLGL